MTLPSVQLIHGDCLKVMPTLPAGSVQMVFADLPYAETQNKWDLEFPLSHFFAQMTKLSPKTTVMTATFLFAVRLFQGSTQKFLYEIIWDKTRASSFAYAKHRPLRSHEMIMVFGGAGGIYHPQYTDGHKPRKRGAQAPRASSNGGPIPLPVATTTRRYPLSVLQQKKDDPRLSQLPSHPTQKPVGLLEWLIRTYTNEGDTVLDPTAGSMTTAIAALRTGRNAICIEKDAEYFRVGSERVKAEQERLASDLFSGRAASEQLRA